LEIEEYSIGAWGSLIATPLRKSVRAVLNVLHLLELRDEIGAYKPTVSGVWFRETKLLEVTEPGHFRRAGGGSRIFVRRVRPVRDSSAGQPSVQGRDAVGGQLDLLLMLDVGDGSRADP
jgi:hypothetical protein